MFLKKYYEYLMGSLNTDNNNSNNLINFKLYIESYAKNELLDNYIIENIYNLLTKINFEKDNEYILKVEVLNDIKRILNTYEDNDSFTFYTLEKSKRIKMNPKYLTAYDILIIRQLVCEDVFVLFYYDENTSYDDFKNHGLDYLIESPFYYESLRSLLFECPILLNSNVFQDRMFETIKGRFEAYSDEKKLFKTAHRFFKKYTEIIITK